MRLSGGIRICGPLPGGQFFAFRRQPAHQRLLASGGLVGSAMEDQQRLCPGGKLLTLMGWDARRLVRRGRSRLCFKAMFLLRGNLWNRKCRCFLRRRPSGAALGDNGKNAASVQRCCAQGTVTGGTWSGGLIGNASNTVVENCYTTVTVKNAVYGGVFSV